MENNIKQKKISIKTLTRIALFAAVICILAPFTVPIGPVPITLATFAVYLTGAMLPTGSAVAATLVYLAIGACGLPVFSGLRGGFEVIAGATGGYLIGYLFCVAVESLFVRFKSDSPIMSIIGMILGTILLYTVGTVWFCISGNYTFIKALPICVLPFLPGDVLKIIAVAILSNVIKKRLNVKR